MTDEAKHPQSVQPLKERVFLIDREAGVVLIYNPNVSETAALLGFGLDVMPLDVFEQLMAEEQGNG